jgi:hypothetical protein
MGSDGIHGSFLMDPQSLGDNQPNVDDWKSPG